MAPWGGIYTDYLMANTENTQKQKKTNTLTFDNLTEKFALTCVLFDTKFFKVRKQQKIPK